MYDSQVIVRGFAAACYLYMGRGTEMRGRNGWKLVLALFGISVLLPYVVTLLWSKQPVVLPVEEFYSGKSVVEESGEVQDVEEYLVGVVAGQMPASYGLEALKAQAVLARTAVYRCLDEQGRADVKTLGLKSCSMLEMEQMWGKSSLEQYYTLVRRAVKETAGQTLQYESEYIEPLYHLASGGSTRPDTSGYLPYLKQADSSRDLELEGCTQAVILTEAQFAQALTAEAGDCQVSPEQLLESIQVVKKDSSGYVERIMIGGFEFTGLQAASAAGISSCCFSAGAYGTAENGENQLQIIAYGIGHGYGLSQYGASRMAEEGADYREILNHYFQNVEIAEEA